MLPVNEVAVAPRRFIESLMAMSGISLVLMLSALDQTVVANALPTIATDLNGFELYAWVATGYLLASVLTIPIAGRLGDYYGRKPFVLLATAVFTLASCWCALTDQMVGLVIARCIQGIGGGALVGTAFACIPELFPETRQRLRWQMMLSVAFSVVNAIGPLLGGALTTWLGWRSVFYLNLPLGVLAGVCVWRYLPWLRPRREHPVRLDWPGALLVMLLLAALQTLTDRLGRPHGGIVPWLLGAVVVIATLLLIWWQRRAVDPLLPPELFTDARLRGLFLLSALAGGVMFALLFYMPLLLQAGYGYSLHQAGVVLTPLMLCITLGALVNGRIVTRLARPGCLPLFGFGLLGAGCVGIAASGLHATPAVLFAWMFVVGTGLGFILMNLTLFTQAAARPEHLGIATALLQSLRLLGGMLATSMFGLVVAWVYRAGLTQRLQQHHGGPIPAEWLQPQWLLQATHTDRAAGPLQLPLQSARAALGDALDLGSMLLAALTLAAIVCLLRMPPLGLKSPWR